jgi:hypothetical protein
MIYIIYMDAYLDLVVCFSTSIQLSNLLEIAVTNQKHVVLDTWYAAICDQRCRYYNKRRK